MAKKMKLFYAMIMVGAVLDSDALVCAPNKGKAKGVLKDEHPVPVDGKIVLEKVETCKKGVIHGFTKRSVPVVVKTESPAAKPPKKAAVKRAAKK